MLELELDPKTLKRVKDHQFYLFPLPATHTNQTNRPTEYADENVLETYAGRGSNGSARLHPDVLTPANCLMAALLDYGDEIEDWSMQSAVIQNGYRPDDESQGRNYLRIINQTIARNPTIFGNTRFPDDLPMETYNMGSTRCVTYGGCRESAEVVFCTVTGMGHCWPEDSNCGPVGGPMFGVTDFKASPMMWEFFQRHPMP